MLPRRLLQLLSRTNNDLFRDDFNGSTIKPQWTSTDTESKLSVTTSKLNFAGRASPNWGDPRLVGTAVQRLAGVTLESEITITSGSPMIVGFATTSSNPSWTNTIGLDFSETASTLYLENHDGETSNPALPLTYAASTSYRVRVVLKSPGALWYISSDGGTTWYLLWETVLGSTTPLYPIYLINGTVGTSQYARVYRGWVKPADYSATPAAPVPALGAEILTNGDMELDANWSNRNTPTLNERSSEQAHGGTYSRKFTADAAADGLQQAATVVAGGWYQFIGWLYGDGNTYIVGSSANSWFNKDTGAAPAAWTQHVITGRAGGTSVNIMVQSQGASTAYIDDYSLKRLTLSSLLTLLVDPGTKNGIVDSVWSIAASTQAGHAIWVDDETSPLYGVFAYVDRTDNQAKLIKVVNGTTTELIAAAVTYGATKVLRTHAIGTSVALYYDGTQVGTTQTISDSGFGTKVCSFATSASSTPGAHAVRTGVGV